MSGLLDPIFNSPLYALVKNLLMLFTIVMYFAVIFWTWRDANRRGAMGWFWGLSAAIFPFVGWLVYLVVRPPETVDDSRERSLEIQAREAQIARDFDTCPSCFKPVERDFLICPYCMKKLRKPCVECGKALKLNWQVCPYCKTKQQ
ncbi:MAG: zinc ribbon domain-containing protein [Coriobacteriia bacterium]|nr:zinc ribbon domain-containing protein [Coriobacteriia bacterium]